MELADIYTWVASNLRFSHYFSSSILDMPSVCSDGIDFSLTYARITIVLLILPRSGKLIFVCLPARDLDVIQIWLPPKKRFIWLRTGKISQERIFSHVNPSLISLTKASGFLSIFEETNFNQQFFRYCNF